jgi:hypothetical protein
MTSSAHCQSQSNFHAHFHLAVNGNFQLKLFRLNNLAEWGEREDRKVREYLYLVKSDTKFHVERGTGARFLEWSFVGQVSAELIGSRRGETRQSSTFICSPDSNLIQQRIQRLFCHQSSGQIPCRLFSGNSCPGSTPAKSTFRWLL